jgi:hypothetical protein
MRGSRVRIPAKSLQSRRNSAFFIRCFLFKKSLIFVLPSKKNNFPEKMLVKEKTDTSRKTFSKTEKQSKKSFDFSKKGLLIVFSLILGIGLATYALFPEPKSQEDELADLIRRLEGGEVLPSGEMVDYCRLMAILRDSISPSCVCVLDGINWDNPPRSPEKLTDEWEFIEDDPNKGFRPRYRHKFYPKIIIGFDIDDSNGNEKPHWHRENPNKQHKKVPYLDKDCNPIRRNSPQSHIYIRTKK